MKFPAATLALLCSFAATAPAQEGVPQPPGLVPEQMWPAPTAEDWAKPVPIRWQRTWDDAVRLSQETKRPILVCVNMDGEIASEHYAGIRYRDPEIAKLYEPYVCVIASVYRHNPRDYDEHGNRIPCPRLGCVTCGEHIAMEPIVYAKFLDGKRISPRHIMVELDGTETYDVFYTWDTQSVFDTLKNGIQNRKIQPNPVVKGDRSLLEKVGSPDSTDRDAIEREFAAGTPEQQQAIVAAALELGERAPIEVLRLAGNGLDPDLAKRARQGLLQAKDPGAVELIADTLRAQLPKGEREALVSALDKFADESTRARTLATAHRGLAGQQAAIDAKKWQSVLEGPAYSGAFTQTQIAAEASARDEVLAKRPADPEALLDVAESNLLQALAAPEASGPGAQRQADRFREMLLLDADRKAQQAFAAGATGWRLAAIRAVTCKHLGREAQAHALAVQAAPDLPPDAPGQLAMETLALFAEARQLAIQQAVRDKQPWSPQWTTDVHAAYAVLERHPLGTDAHFAWHYDFLQFFGTPEADAVLDRGLARFPGSALLHERLRARALAKGGPAGLEAEYEKRLAAADAPTTLPWFAGYADLCVAEAHRRANQSADAIAAYERGIARFERYREATGATDGTHFVAVAHAGIARVKLQYGDLQGAFAALRASFAANPAAAAATDGLSVTGMQTAEALRAKANEAGLADLVGQLDAELKKLPDDAYVLPDYEQASRGGQRMGRRRQ